MRLKHEVERNEVVRTVNELYDAGLITPTGGNVSLRLPKGEGYLITPSAMFKGGLRPEDIVFVDPEGNPEAGAPAPSIETSMHLQIYAVRQDVNAVIHAHPPMAILVGALGIRVPALVMEAVVLSEIPLIPFMIPGSQDLAQKVSNAFSSNVPIPAVQLQNHGIVTVGSSLREASNIALAFEEVCKLAVISELIGRKPVEIPQNMHQEIIYRAIRRYRPEPRVSGAD